MRESFKQGDVSGIEQENQMLVIEARRKMGEIFDGAKPKERMDYIMIRIKPFLEANLFEEELAKEIVGKIEKAVELDDREIFVDTMMEILKPFISFRTANREKFDNVRRERNEFTIVNEAIYYEIDYSNGEKYIRIHLSGPQGESMTDKKNLFKKTKEAFAQIAELMKADDSIKFVSGTSPLIAQNPRFAEQIGFEDIKPISEELRQAHFKNETRPVFQGIIPREKFIEKYGK